MVVNDDMRAVFTDTDIVIAVMTALLPRIRTLLTANDQERKKLCKACASMMSISLSSPARCLQTFIRLNFLLVNSSCELCKQ